MIRRIVLLFLLATASLTPAAAAADTPPVTLTQRELALELVNGLGWSFGLPDTPTDADYLRILSGERRLRLEVERLIDNNSPLLAKEIFSFGNYSGDGWLQGPIAASSESFPFLLPLSGTYRVKARLMKEGFALQFGSSRLTADGGPRFTDVDCGEIALNAGKQQVVVHVPSRAGIDYIELEAPPAPAIAPPGGWDLERKLTTSDLASVALQVLALSDRLPDTASPLRIEAESLPLPKGFSHQDTSIHGTASAGGWIRADTDRATWRVKLRVPKKGYYALTVRAIGRGTLSLLINDRVPEQIQLDPVFKPQPMGAADLLQGKNLLTFDIPAFAGIDYIELTPLDSTPEAIMHLAGLPEAPLATRSDLDRVISLLAAFGIRR